MTRKEKEQLRREALIDDLQILAGRIATMFRNGGISATCTTALESIGFSTAQIADKLDTIIAVDGSENTTLLGDIFSPGDLGYQYVVEGNMTVGSMLGKNSKTTAVSSMQGPEVYFNTLRQGKSRLKAGSAQWEKNAGLVLHETLHKFGYFDKGLQQFFFGAGAPEVDAPSVNISEFLSKTCFNDVDWWRD